MRVIQPNFIARTVREVTNLITYIVLYTSDTATHPLNLDVLTFKTVTDLIVSLALAFTR